MGRRHGSGVGASTRAYPITSSSQAANNASDPDDYGDIPDGNWFMVRLQ